MEKKTLKKKKTLTTRARHLGNHGALLHVEQHDAVPGQGAGRSSRRSRATAASTASTTSGSNILAAAAQQQPARAGREDRVRHPERARDRLGGLVAQVLDRDEVGLAVEHCEAVAGDEDGPGAGAAAGLGGRVRRGSGRSTTSDSSSRRAAAVPGDGVQLVAPTLGVVVRQQRRRLGRVVRKRAVDPARGRPADGDERVVVGDGGGGRGRGRRGGVARRGAEVGRRDLGAAEVPGRRWWW